MSQKGKVALVTGGAQGIGRAIVDNLLAEGASVAILDLDQTLGEATAQELSKKYPGRVIFSHCDVTDHAQFEECFSVTLKTFNHLEIVVNNAGVAVENGDVWIKMININFTAVVKGTKLGEAYMSKERGGRGGTIVNVASEAALKEFPTLPVYSGTKAAVAKFSSSYGHEMYEKKTGVKVVAICPGLTDTDLTAYLIPRGIADDPVKSSSWKYVTDNGHLQKANTVGRGLIEVLQKGQTGSIWRITCDKAPELAILH